MTDNQQGYEALFSYGYLRANYLSSDLSSGILPVKRFVRPESLSILRNALLADARLLTPNNTVEQLQLSPVSRQCLWELHSGIMIRMLENITQLSNLLPDPHFNESKLHTLPCDNFTLTNWTNPDTRLNAALVLIIDLGNGDAYFCTTPTALSGISLNTTSLQMTYWTRKHSCEDDK